MDTSAPFHLLSTGKLLAGASATLALCVAVLACAHKTTVKIRRGLPLPPGPAPLPLVGNLFDIPITRSWLTLAEWAKTYGEYPLPLDPSPGLDFDIIGDLVHVNVLGQDLVFVNSLKVANDLFDKRSSIYSDRPRLTLVNEL
jgi:hypothetical protein